jgi:hypothetical protein
MEKEYYIYWHPRGQKRRSFNHNRSIVKCEPSKKDKTVKDWKKSYPNRVYENISRK